MDTNLIETPQPTKIKVQYANPVFEQKEITLPYYFKHGGTFYKVEGEKIVLSACAFDDYAAMQQTSLSANVVKYLNEGTVITETEFLEVYNSALSKIQNL